MHPSTLPGPLQQTASPPAKAQDRPSRPSLAIWLAGMLAVSGLCAMGYALYWELPVIQALVRTGR